MTTIATLKHKMDAYGNHWLEVVDTNGTKHECRPATYRSVAILQHGDEIFGAVTAYYDCSLPEVFKIQPVAPDESVVPVDHAEHFQLQFEDAEAS